MENIVEENIMKKLVRQRKYDQNDRDNICMDRT